MHEMEMDLMQQIFNKRQTRIWQSSHIIRLFCFYFVFIFLCSTVDCVEGLDLLEHVIDYEYKLIKTPLEITFEVKVEGDISATGRYNSLEIYDLKILEYTANGKGAFKLQCFDNNHKIISRIIFDGTYFDVDDNKLWEARFWTDRLSPDGISKRDEIEFYEQMWPYSLVVDHLFQHAGNDCTLEVLAYAYTIEILQHDELAQGIHHLRLTTKDSLWTEDCPIPSTELTIDLNKGGLILQECERVESHHCRTTYARSEPFFVNNIWIPKVCNRQYTGEKATFNILTTIEDFSIVQPPENAFIVSKEGKTIIRWDRGPGLRHYLQHVFDEPGNMEIISGMLTAVLWIFLLLFCLFLYMKRRKRLM